MSGLRTCAKLPPVALPDSLVKRGEECNKNARQNVLLGAPGAIIDNLREPYHRIGGYVPV
jgi:hypothetical protein